MKTTINHILFTFLFCACIVFNAQSQIEISEDIDIAKIASGTTYVIMKDPKSESVKEYVDVFKKYWTISKVEFISYQGIDSLLSPGNSFISISSNYFTEVQSSNIHFYLEFWTCFENFLKKKEKKKNIIFKEYDKKSIVRVELFPDYVLNCYPDSINKINFDGKNHYLNWGPGFLKNYILSISSYLSKKESRSLYKNISNKNELINLKKEIIYIPKYVLLKKKVFSTEARYYNENELLEDYKFKYKIISDSVLNEKTLNEKSVFYYLIYIQSSTDKYICIVNSLTGEFIYSNYTAISYGIKSKDFKYLYEEIQSL